MLSSPAELIRFADKFELARQLALKEISARGTCGLELEWNMVDSDLRPLQRVKADAEHRSFVDVLRGEYLPPVLKELSQLEVFHWMIEWATRPYYSPIGPIFEARLIEAGMGHALKLAADKVGGRLYAYPGNLLALVDVGHDSVPTGWNLAKRRYLERCVDIYGADLATAGIHANLSLPEPLLSSDFLHLSPSERGDAHLDDYKNRVYIEATRLLRAFAALFVATAGSTPLKPELRDGEPVAVLTEYNSVRNLTFPNPPTIDLPNLYRSYQDYLRLSYDLVRRGIRFGNNNWTPTRARSFAEPVERLIQMTSDQLLGVFRGGQDAGEGGPTPEQLAREIEVQNLLARIDIPMARVEVRTDEGGHPFDLDVANLALKELLLIRFYADPAYGRAFRYDDEDLARARRNELRAAREGLQAELEDPWTGKPIVARQLLRRVLDELRPLAEALERLPWLAPLEAMAAGEPNTSDRLRMRLFREIGADMIVPPEVLRQLAEEREQEVARDVERIALDLEVFEEADKLRPLVREVLSTARHMPQLPPEPSLLAALKSVSYPDKMSEIVGLAKELIAIPSVSTGVEERQRIDDIHRAIRFAHVYLKEAGLAVRTFGDGEYPSLLVGFPGCLEAPIMLAGHVDVVEPDPDESQFEPRIDGEYLWGRGAADMKTVVATFLVWMKDERRKGPPYPWVNLLLVGNEETGEGKPMGTPHVLALLRHESGYGPQLVIAGERTGEAGDELMGEICVENRGLVRAEIILRGRREHTGTRRTQVDLSKRLFQVHAELVRILESRLTLREDSSWRSQVIFPYVKMGEPGIYNIAAAEAAIGIEIRPIPEDDIHPVLELMKRYCDDNGIELTTAAAEAGVRCNPENPWLRALSQSVRETCGAEPTLGRKLPATSARFAPEGQGIVWGQSGVGPHAADERHFIPSILPYYSALQRLGERTRTS